MRNNLFVKGICVLFFMLCLVSGGAQKAFAARVTGSDLLAYCNMDEKGNELVKGGHTTCQAYISGVIDYHNMLRSMKIAPEVNICVPQDTTLYALHLTVLKYLRKNKGNTGAFIAAPAVTMALFNRYPCRKR